MISATQLASLRATALATLTATCDLQRRTPGTATGLGRPLTYPPVATGVACSIAPRTLQGDERDVGGRQEAHRFWLIRLPAGTDVRMDDELVSGGRRFRVTGLQGPRTVEITRLVEAVEV